MRSPDHWGVGQSGTNTISMVLTVGIREFALVFFVFGRIGIDGELRFRQKQYIVDSPGLQIPRSAFRSYHIANRTLIAGSFIFNFGG